MRGTIIYISTLLLGCLMPVWLTAQQRVTVTITSEDDGTETVFDTTFVIGPDFDLDAWIDALQLRRTDPGESVSTTIVIQDEVDHRATADLYRPEPSGREPGMLGIYVDTDQEYEAGVPIKELAPGGAAEQAGMQPGDTVVEMRGQAIANLHDMGQAKQGSYAGDSMEVVVRRNGERIWLQVVLTGREPMDEAKEKIRTHSPRAYLGVYTEDLNRERAEAAGMSSLQGVYLEGVVDGSAAEQAGLRKGDVIVKMNDYETQAAWELSEVLRDLNPQDSLKLVYIRQGQRDSTLAVVSSRPSPRPRVEQRPRRMLIEESRAYLGVTLQTHSNQPGVTVLEVSEASAAEVAGIRAGDRILAVAGQATPNYDSLAAVMRRLNPDERVRIRYARGDEEATARAKLGYRSVKTWVRVDPEQNLDPKQIMMQVKGRDPEEAEALFRDMESPSLDMAFFECYPNPNEGRFTLNFDMADAQAPTELRVYAPNGQVVYVETLAAGAASYRQEIDLGDNIVDGLYLVQVSQRDRGMVQRVIVQRCISC